MPQEKIPLDLRHLPERQEGEELITDKQITFIIHLTGCERKVIERLGKLQASELIENILEERDENRAISESTPRKKAGRGSLFALILLVGFCFFIWRFYSSSETGDSSTRQPELAAGADQAPSMKPTGNPSTQEGVSGIPTPPSADTIIPDGNAATAGQIARMDGLLESLEGVDLPASLLVLSPVQLLDHTGKETTVSADTQLEVLTRREGGTLTMRSGLETFVGNETRLRDKVRLADRIAKPE